MNELRNISRRERERERVEINKRETDRERERGGGSEKGYERDRVRESKRVRLKILLANTIFLCQKHKLNLPSCCHTI